ncbi:DUF3892 domain-containing protein [Aneurinibacillus thermoaerophilus]|uniref:DUF3892 domain-containing protein n=1 Tax=Aneurinibacillus thermoaerophilus TaxID=143495 RepID=UPI002E1AF8F1|nr:DUF3892 domain-containing protein [Aneurinibacillus thermoaerophilus]MED0761855.1 DUF3892 domain-containing protein [Aneurinibacillus thermoaerophilus]
MSKYVIVEVHYVENEETKYIEEVKTNMLTSENKVVEISSFVKRESVINRIIFNIDEYWTAIKENGEWKIGAKVIVEELDGNKFIKTVKNGKKEDNLSELPTY